MSEIYCPRCKTSFVPTEPDTHHFYMCPHCGYIIENTGFNRFSHRKTTGYRQTHTGKRSVEGL